VAAVRFVTPEEGATVTRVVSLTATLQEASVGDGVRYLVAGTVLGTSYTAPYLFAWDTTAVPQGPAVLTAQVVGADGQPRLSATDTRQVLVAHPRTVVTLGFDDGTADHFAVASELASFGLRGTFYVNSGRLGTGPKYLTMAQVQQMQAQGHEIGGHTVFHLHLSQQDHAEQQRQICTDRNQLLAAGLNISDVAYPFGDLSDAAKRAVEFCGYNSARTSGGIGCTGCPSAEPVPPADLYAMRSISSLTSQTTTAELIGYVNAAERSGGWLQLVFHMNCDGSACAPDAIRADQFTAFVRWLSGQQAQHALTVAPVRDVVGGAVRPAVAPPPPTATQLAVQNASFEESTSAGGVPRCYELATDGGSQAFTAARVPDAHSGRWAERIEVTGALGGARVITTQDLGSCAPPVLGGHGYSLGVWYKSTVPVKIIAYYRLPAGGFHFLGGSQEFPPASTWTYASWTSRAVPDSLDSALSFGLWLPTDGAATVDDLSVADAGVPPAKPSHAGASHSATPKTSRPPEPGQYLAFHPPVGGLAVPAGPEANAAAASRSAWLLPVNLALLLGAGYAVLVLVDRRLVRLHRRTRLRPGQRIDHGRARRKVARQPTPPVADR